MGRIIRGALLLRQLDELAALECFRRAGCVRVVEVEEEVQGKMDGGAGGGGGGRRTEGVEWSRS